MATVRVETTDSTADSAAPASVQPRPPIVVDMGKRSRKKVRRLRRGQGPLMAEANEVLAELRAADKVSGDTQVVVLVVKQKPKKSKRFLRGLI